MNKTKFCFLIVLLVLGSNLFAAATTQDDTVKVNDLITLPQIDGKGDDACWQDIAWQSVNQVWIPYGGSVSADDYSGRYKVAWSSTENLLYFLFEVVDDVAVGGYKRGGQTADNYHYDLVEVFIDEDKSGGLHVFDGTGSTAAQWGSNAENAFSYHIYADFPEEGEVTTTCDVGDTDGTSWNDAFSPQYAPHFPEFALRKTGNTYTREFSLKVYNDTYDDANPEASRVTLETGKIIGLSVAVCDNDGLDENPKTRDNFFGSVWVTAAAYNDHWMNADDYGTLELVSAPNTGIPELRGAVESFFQVYPNPANDRLCLKMNPENSGHFDITLYNLMGQEVLNISRTTTIASVSEIILPQNLPTGTYFIEVNSLDQRAVQKFLITK